MNGRHTLLTRQLRRHLGGEESLPPGCTSFIDAVDAAYKESDLDRGMLERALDLSSQELLESNVELRGIRDQLELRVVERTAALSHANLELKGEIAERKRFEAQLLHIANHDPLTDLFNRRRFEEEVDKNLCPGQRDLGQGAVLLLDLDQFKDVNDSLGHRAGDDLLRGVADLLRSFLREQDVLARCGEDEFAVLLPDTGAAPARGLANRIEDAVRHHTFLVGHRPINVTASIGLALFPRHGSRAEEVLSNADLAMYQAKANGRGRVEVFRADRDWRSVSEDRLRWRNLIIEALLADKFLLYAQPIHSFRPRDARDYEILLRLPTERGQVARPGVFLGVAEDFGLIQEIDRWVMRQAIRLIARQERAGVKVRLAVNLSGRSFGDAELLALIRSQLALASIDPANLVPEVTETATMANLAQAQKFIRTLKDLGCQLSLDDFGSGFSSLSQLKRLPVDYLKIDGTFIRDLARSEVDRELVKAIVAVARGLNKQTIAEFVGDEATLNLVRDYGVDFAQGYYLGRPRDVHKVLVEGAGRRAA